METGNIIWIDGKSPAIVVGSGTDKDGLPDGKLYVVELGGVRVLEPDDEGGYPFGNAPYDQGDEPGAGNFGPDTPVKPVERDKQQDGVTYDEGSEQTTQGGTGGTPAAPSAPWGGR